MEKQKISSYDVADEMQDRLELLVESFNSFRAEFGMTLHVKDFCGYMVSHPLLGEFCESYLFHESSYCSYVKSSPAVREQCVISSNELLMRCLVRRQEALAGLPRHSQHRARGFYGVCWCGMREYVYPIYHNGIIIGALLAGLFEAEPRRKEHAFERLQNRYGLDEARLRVTYDESLLSLPDNPENMERQVALFATYLSMLAEYYIEYSLISAYNDSIGGHTQRHKIINLAIDYITKNLSRKISVSDMGVHCMCSKSTLNHMFSSVMGRTIPEFVSIQRVNRAKYLILNTTLSIEQIGMQCGFASAAYFSVVFKKLTDVTPTEYRVRMTSRSVEDITGII